MSRVKVSLTPDERGWVLEATCLDHPDFRWIFDAPSHEPENWDDVQMVAKGHHVHHHPVECSHWLLRDRFVWCGIEEDALSDERWWLR